MAVGKDVSFANAVTCGDAAAVLSHSTFPRGGIAPISSHGGVR